MKVDIFTMNMVMILFSVVQAVILMVQFRLNRNYDGLGYWMMGSVMAAAGFASNLFRDIEVARVFVIIVGNVLLTASLLFFHEGTFRFLDRKGSLIPQRILFGVFVAAVAFFTLVNDNIEIRVVIISVFTSFLSFVNARSLLPRRGPKAAAPVNISAAAFLATGIFFAVRATDMLLLGGGHSYFAPTLMQIGMFILLFVCNNLWTFGFIAMVNNRMQNELKESKERFEAIFNTSPDGTIIFRSEDGVIVDVNEGFSLLTGFSRQETVGKTAGSVGLWKDMEQRRQFIAVLSAAGFCDNMEGIFQRKDGTEILGILSAQTIMLQGKPHVICVARDISARRKAEEAVRQSEELYRSILNASPDGIVVLDLEGRICKVSPKAREIFNVANEQSLIGLPHLHFIAPEDQERARTNIGLMFQGVFTGPAEYRGITPGGKIIDIEANAEFVRDMEGNPTNIMVIIREISERKQAEILQRHNVAVQVVLKGIAEAAVLAPSMIELYATVHRLVSGIFPAKLFHINLLDESTGEIVVPYRADEVNFVPERRPVGKGMTEYVMRLGRAVHVTPAEMDRLRSTGEYALVNAGNVQMRHYLGAPLINHRGKPFGVMALILSGDNEAFQPEDVEVFSIIAAQVSISIERKRLEEELKLQAMTDGLTGILNRRYFLFRVEEELKRIHRYAGDCALMILDMDHFKDINDTYGHRVGDAALQMVAAACRTVLRDTDVLGRIGGEEFAVLLLESSAEASSQVAERLRQSIQDISLHTEQGMRVYLSASIGVTDYLPTESVSTVMRRADKALYQAKNAGRNKVSTVFAASQLEKELPLWDSGETL